MRVLGLHNTGHKENKRPFLLHVTVSPALMSNQIARVCDEQGGFAGILGAIHRLEGADLHTVYPLALVQAERDRRLQG